MDDGIGGGGGRFGPIPGSRARGAIDPCPGSWKRKSSMNLDKGLLLPSLWNPVLDQT